MEELKMALSEFGIVKVCKDDYVFTMYMQSDSDLKFNAKTMFKVFGLCCDYVGDRKPNVEVVVNDNSFILIVLKPA